MAEATTQITVTPKQLGKHLRSIRRKKGLSLSEVARGAGLSRRELVGYERGKVSIPESDLWVLAGSCGVDVAELMPSASSLELTEAANATSVGDTVSQLRRSQEDAGITAYLHTLQKLQALPPGKRIPVKDRELEEIATALGSTPRSIEQKLQEVLQVSPDEAERLRAMILVPPNAKGKPRALAAAPSALPAPALAAPAPAVAAVEASPMAAVPTPTPFAVPEPVAPVAPPEPLQTFPAAPAAFLDQPIDAPIDPVHGNNIDVFEELARLPEPVPLGDPSAPVPDLLAPQDPFAAEDPFATPLVGVPAVGPPEGAVELVDSTMPGTAATAAATGAAAWNAADAPPIDVAMRQGSSTWDLGEPPLVAKSSPASDPTSWETEGWQPPAPDGTDGTPGGFWEGTDDWAPATGATELVDAPVDETPRAEPAVIGESTWAGSAWDPEPWSPPAAAAADTAVEVNPWTTEEWPREPADVGAWDHQPDPAAVDSGFYVDWGTPDTETPPGWDAFADVAAEPEVDAVDTVDVDPVDAAPVWDTWSQPVDTFETAEASVEVVDDVAGEPTDEPPAWDTWSQPGDAVQSLETFETFETFETVETFETFESGDTTPFVAGADGTVELPHISWRADGPDVVDAAEVAFAATAFVEPGDEIAPSDVPPLADWDVDTSAQITTPEADAAASDWSEPSSTWTEPVEPVWIEAAAETTDSEIIEPETFDSEILDSEILDSETIDSETIDSEIIEPELAPVIEEFVAAGPDWQLGNALPLVEVRGQGGLVMRRADERWALADVTTTSDFVAEVEVDFRSGPGLGVLFRASIDDEGRMSGYSFDIDPIYDGGGYLVRQWQSDRELWNPIARVGGDDPTSMYGTLLVRIEVNDEHLSAQVNGVEVLTVENLKQASADRGRDAATGDRIGVQAWSSSDLVIDTVRVASR